MKGSGALLISMLFLAGCTPLGMIYVHRDTLGLDVSTGVDATAPFKVNLGTSNHMGTYVPVGIPSGNIPVGSRVGEITSAVTRGMQPQDAKDIVNSIASSDLIDMFSVYSSFESRTDTKAGVLKLDRGNLFATGIAARRMAETERARTCLALEGLAKAETDATKQAEIRKTIAAVCA
jgi:hypothetical protein